MRTCQRDSVVVVPKSKDVCGDIFAQRSRQPNALSPYGHAFGLGEGPNPSYTSLFSSKKRCTPFVALLGRNSATQL
jgi:hypothetical protein